jgi:hypothetical protein
MAESKIKPDGFGELPSSAVAYINLVIKNMRYRKNARDEVSEELIDHFEEHLNDCATNEEKEQKAQQLISEFGDAKLLAKLMRRAKKRCRPLWQKILVRSSAAVLIIFAYLFICASWLRMGSPTIRINYAQWLTDKQRQGRDESLNAKPEIDKAAELIKKYPGWTKFYYIPRIWPGDMNETYRTELTETIQAVAEPLNILNKAMEKPYFWADYNTVGPLVVEANSVLVLNPDFFDSVNQPLGPYRQIAQILATRVNWRAYSGDIDGAVDDIVSLFRFASHLEQSGLLVEQLVATTIEALSLQITIMVLSRVDMPAAQLKRLQDEFTVTFAKHELPIDLDGEKVFWYAIIQQGFTDNGKGNGRIINTSLLYFAGDWKNTIWSFLTFSYPDRQQALAQVEKAFAEGQQKFETTPWQRTAKITKSTPVMGNLQVPFKIIEPAYDSISVIAWRFKTRREATLTILAVLRYQKEKGKYPDTLEELVKAGYLTKLPHDPFSPGPLTYKKTEDGFLLYSWGENLKDDNGEVVRNEKGKTIWFPDEGDWVFWPVEKN